MGSPSADSIVFEPLIQAGAEVSHEIDPPYCKRHILGFVYSYYLGPVDACDSPLMVCEANSRA